MIRLRSPVPRGNEGEVSYLLLLQHRRANAKSMTMGNYGEKKEKELATVYEYYTNRISAFSPVVLFCKNKFVSRQRNPRKMVGYTVKECPIEKEYLKNKDIKPQDIEKLRQWLLTQPHLPAEHITDLDLILVFHCCSRSTGMTKQVLDLHYTLNTLFTGYFKDRKLDDNLISTISNVLITFLPTRSNNGDAILFIRIINEDPKVFDFGSWIRATFTMIDLHQYMEGTLPGLILVLDFGIVTLRHLTKVDITNLRQLLYYLQEAMFLNLRGLHFLNAPSFIDKLIMMMKPFMKKELMDTFQVHTVGSTTVEKFFPISALPKESGGNYKSIIELRDEMLELIKNAGEFLEKDNKKRVNEALRPGRAKTISDIFDGVEGSFKKLDID